jgi:hypothetical protein
VIGEVRAWLESQGRSGRPGRPATQTSKDMDVARLREQIARAQQREMDLALQQGLYLPRATVDEGRARRVLAVKSALYALVESAGEKFGVAARQWR